ncbi:MAG: hypothetical protein ABSC03_17070 [Verrucomicrobiota bacterium]
MREVEDKFAQHSMVTLAVPRLKVEATRSSEVVPLKLKPPAICPVAAVGELVQVPLVPPVTELAEGLALSFK